MSEPPPNVPRIVDVIEPSTGHYVVMVRMPTNLASKWPDKPWGTPIADIGLSAKDSAQYPGYTLVDVEMMKGSPDLLWIFQKLDGPEWTTKSQGQDSLIPAKYRRLVTTTRTKQEVAPGTDPDAIQGGVVQSVVEQQENTGKAVKVTTAETIATNGTPLTGEQFAPNGAVLATSESLIAEGDAADKGVNIAQSTVSPTGDGKAIKDTATAKKRVVVDNVEGVVEGWPKKQVKSKGAPSLTPQKFRGQVTTTTTVEQMALNAEDVDDIPEPPAPTGNQTVIEHQKVNDWRYEKSVTEEVIAESDPLSGSFTDEWGVGATEESLVAEGTNTDFGFGVKSGRVTPIGGGKAIKETDLYPAVDDPQNEPHVIYTLTEEATDPLTSAPITIKKSLVDAAHAAALSAAMRAEGWYTEIKGVDKWHSILISQKLSPDILGVTHTWTETANISLPDVLTEVGVIWDGDADGSGGSSGVDHISAIVAENYRWAVEAEANSSAVITGRPYTKTERGYSGPAEITVERTFHSSPPTGTITPHKFGEVYGTLTICGSQMNSVAKSSKNGVGGTSIANSQFNRSHQDNNMAIHFFGPIVHSGVTLTETGDPKTQTQINTAYTGSTPGGGIMPTATASASVTGVATLKLPSSGSLLAPGDTFVVGVDVNYYKLGYWVKEIRTAKVP